MTQLRYPPKLASSDMLRYGKVRELLALPPLFRVGLSKDLRPLKITDRGDIVTYPVETETWMPILDEAFGFNALVQALGRKGLAAFINPFRFTLPFSGQSSL